jgi:hypothetical protein
MEDMIVKLFNFASIDEPDAGFAGAVSNRLG